MTCSQVGNNLSKGGLIPHVVVRIEPYHQSLRALEKGLAAYQVVGGVMAYQAEDG